MRPRSIRLRANTLTLLLGCAIACERSSTPPIAHPSPAPSGCALSPDLPSAAQMRSSFIRTPDSPARCDLEQIAPGGFDLSKNSSNIVVADIPLCVGEVIEAAEQWSSARGFTVVMKEDDLRSLRMHIAGAGGHFELDYRVDEEDEIARASMWYVDGNGQPTLASRIADVRELQETVDTALQCRR